VLSYGELDLQLYGYTYADYASDLDERKLTSAYAFSLGGGVVSLCSKKQSVVTLSTMEVEFVAALFAAQEAIWLR